MDPRISSRSPSPVAKGGIPASHIHYTSLSRPSSRTSSKASSRPSSRGSPYGPMQGGSLLLSALHTSPQGSHFNQLVAPLPTSSHHRISPMTQHRISPLPLAAFHQSALPMFQGPGLVNILPQQSAGVLGAVPGSISPEIAAGISPSSQCSISPLSMLRHPLDIHALNSLRHHLPTVPQDAAPPGLRLGSPAGEQLLKPESLAQLAAQLPYINRDNRHPFLHQQQKELLEREQSKADESIRKHVSGQTIDPLLKFGPSEVSALRHMTLSSFQDSRLRNLVTEEELVRLKLAEMAQQHAIGLATGGTSSRNSSDSESDKNTGYFLQDMTASSKYLSYHQEKLINSGGKPSSSSKQDDLHRSSIAQNSSSPHSDRSDIYTSERSLSLDSYSHAKTESGKHSQLAAYLLGQSSSLLTRSSSDPITGISSHNAFSYLNTPSHSHSFIESGKKINNRSSLDEEILRDAYNSRLQQSSNVSDSFSRLSPQQASYSVLNRNPLPVSVPSRASPYSVTQQASVIQPAPPGVYKMPGQPMSGKGFRGDDGKIIKDPYHPSLGKGIREHHTSIGKGPRESPTTGKGYRESPSPGKGYHDSLSPGKGYSEHLSIGKGFHESPSPGQVYRENPSPGKGSSNMTQTPIGKGLRDSPSVGKGIRDHHPSIGKVYPEQSSMGKGIREHHSIGKGPRDNASPGKGFRESQSIGKGFRESPSFGKGSRQSPYNEGISDRHPEPQTIGKGLRESPSQEKGFREPQTIGKGIRESPSPGKGFREPQTIGKGIRESPSPGKGFREPQTIGKGIRESPSPGKGFREHQSIGKGEIDNPSPGKGFRESQSIGKGFRESPSFGKGSRQSPYSEGISDQQPVSFGKGMREPGGTWKPINVANIRTVPSASSSTPVQISGSYKLPYTTITTTAPMDTHSSHNKTAFSNYHPTHIQSSAPLLSATVTSASSVNTSHAIHNNSAISEQNGGPQLQQSMSNVHKTVSGENAHLNKTNHHHHGGGLLQIATKLAPADTALQKQYQEISIRTSINNQDNKDSLLVNHVQAQRNSSKDIIAHSKGGSFSGYNSNVGTSGGSNVINSASSHIPASVASSGGHVKTVNGRGIHTSSAAEKLDNELVDREANLLNMRVPNLGNFPPTQSYKTAYRSQTMALHRAKAGSIVIPVKSLDLLRQNLQKYINTELDSVIQKYMDTYFKPALDNIRENSPLGSVSDDNILSLCSQILEEAKTMYHIETRSVTPDDNASDAGSVSSKATLVENKDIRASKHSLFNIKKRRGSSDSDASAKRKIKKPKNWSGVSGRSTPSKKTSMDAVYKGGPKWDPNRLTTETLFVMGAKANKALGLGNMRGRLYVKHPDMFKYIGDQEDKQWLHENKQMPSTGGKAYLLVLEDVTELAETPEYKNNDGVNFEDVVRFSVPQFIVDKMKIQMKRERSDKGSSGGGSDDKGTTKPKNASELVMSNSNQIVEIEDRLPFTNMYSSDKLLNDTKHYPMQHSPATTDNLDMLSIDQEDLDTPVVSPFNMTGGFAAPSPVHSDSDKLEEVVESTPTPFIFPL